MVVGELAQHTEVAVVGAGPGGYVAALRAADAGFDVTIIDDGPAGGTCLNVGCIPSKTLIELASLHHRATHAPGLVGELTVDMETVNDTLDQTAGGLRRGVEGLLASAGVRAINGRARFSKPGRLSITTGDTLSHLEFEHVILATGSRPTQLGHFPLGPTIVDSTGALALRRLPTSMAVIGGGYIGIELGTAFAKLGSHVSIVEAGPTLLPGLPTELSTLVQRRLEQLNVAVYLNTPTARPEAGRLGLDSERSIPAEVIVVAVGRRPNTDDLGLDVAGVSVDERGLVRTDRHLAAAPGVWAIGDIVAGPALAHKASAEAEVVVENLAGRSVPFDPTAVPAVVFSDPELVSVGVAPDSQPGLTVARFPHSASARARTTGETTGVTIVVADAEGTVVGVHIAGHHASELAGEAALAVEMAATLEDLALTIHPHPTMSETVIEAAHLALGHPLHIRGR